MLFADGFLGLVLVGLWLFCLIDVITTDEAQMRNLPKTAWLFIVLLLFDIGSLLWLVAGREWSHTDRPAAGVGAVARYPEYDRPGRAVPQNPEDDDAFLREVREKAERQRRQYRERRKRELDAEQAQLVERPETDDPR